MADAADIQAVLASGLFELDWYSRHWPSVAGKLEQAVAHFLDKGAALGLDPGPDFSTRRYLWANPDVAAAGVNPLLHYLAYGRAEGRVSFPGGNYDASHFPFPDSAREGREIALLRGHPLFDADFYLDRYPDVRTAGVDPLLHFVAHGAREGRWPNPWFDTAWYRRHYQCAGDSTNPLAHYAESPESAFSWTSELFDGRYYGARYRDVAEADATPLEHFLLNGVESGRDSLAASLAAGAGRIPDPRGIPVTVVVAAHNAAVHLEACLHSLLKHTKFGEDDGLLIINDASDEPEVENLLCRLEGIPGIRVAQNERNLGYTRSANLGFGLAGRNDVVLLNSDTVVAPHWLRNLKIAAYRRTRIGTVTAVSDNAGAFSVPREGTNEMPAGVSVEAWSRAVADANAIDFEVPTGNGFCMYLRRSMLDDIGYFDEDAFPLGYGEENDLCMRALAKGWHHLVSPRVFVHHARSASFGARREELSRAGAERLQQLHPDYPAAAAGITELRGFVLARYRIARRWRALASGARPPRPRILYVLSTDNGGIPRSNADLMRALGGEFDCLVMRCDSSTIELRVLNGEEYSVIERHRLSERIGFATHVGEEYEAVVRDLLLRHSIDLLHIRHLAWHSLNLADVAHGMGLPVVQSIHDYYPVCPSVNLVDRQGRLHPRGVVEDAENALWPHDPAAAIPMSPGRLGSWQRRMQHALRAADALVTTSESARELLLAALPELTEEGPAFHVIPHGRDFTRLESPADTYDVPDGQPLRILLPGNIGLHKGAGLVAQVAEMAPPGALQFHLLGTSGPELKKYVVDHGPYQRGEFATRVAAIRPHLAVILSLAPETWCHTLTECWAAGVPVLALDRGAIGERMRKHGAGWLLEHEADAAVVCGRLLELRLQSEQRIAAVRNVLAWQAAVRKDRGLPIMASAYRKLYEALLHTCGWIEQEHHR